MRLVDESLTTNKMKTTPQQIQAYIEIVRAIADSIKELQHVPAGHIYAVVMGKMSLEQFENIIGKLVSGGLVTRDASHMLHWNAKP